MEERRRGLVLPDLTAAQVLANPYRVLGLPTTATAGEIRRRSEQAAAAHRLGAPQAAAGVLPLPHAPDEATLREAAHRLRDPAGRLLAEVLWLQPDPGPAPARWELGGPVPPGTLTGVWLELAPRRFAALADAMGTTYHSPDEPSVLPGLSPDEAARRAAAAHNLAVLQLLLLARSCADGTAETFDTAWALIPLYWGAWLDTPAAVADVAARARRLGLDDGGAAAGAGTDADVWRRTLTRALLPPLVELVTDRLERGEDVGGRVVRALGLSGLPWSAVAPALSRLAHRSEERVRAIVDDAWARAQADPAHAHEVGEQLLRDARPWFTLLVAAETSDTDDADLAGLRSTANRLADIVAACGINWLDGDADDVERLRAALRLLDAALEITRGDDLRPDMADVRARLEGAVQLLENPPPPVTCLVCDGPAPDDRWYVPVPLDWPAGRARPGGPPPAGIPVRGVTVGDPVLLGLPRCQACTRRQGSTRSDASGAASVVVGAGIFAVTALAAGLWWLLMIVLGLAALLLTPFVRDHRRGSRLRARVADDAAVRGLLGLGYRLRPGFDRLRFTDKGDR